MIEQGYRAFAERIGRGGDVRLDPREFAGYGRRLDTRRPGGRPWRMPRMINRETMLADEFTDSWRTLTGSKPQIAPAQQTTAQGFGSWFGNLLKTGLETVIQVKGQSEIEKMRAKAEIERQRALVSSYGDPRTMQAYSALEMQRQLEAQQRGLEADRIGGVTAPFMSGSTPWILGGVALLGVLLLRGKK